MKRLFGSIAGALLLGLLPSAVLAGENCYCRATDGQRIEVGNFACIKTHSGLKEAKCDYVLNNPAWKFTGNECPVTSVPLLQRYAELSSSGEKRSTAPMSSAVIDFADTSKQ
ncbi:MAG: hypothetical protein AAGE89_17445 [Pseudomonadota bacterium]